MLQQSAKWFLVAALISSLGFHWGILQTAAWVGMVVKYSEEDSFQEALDKTFDGQHPCRVCHLVREGKESEKKSEASFDLKKLDFFMDEANRTFHFTKAPRLPLGKNVNFSSRFESPPTPPPLSA